MCINETQISMTVWGCEWTSRGLETSASQIRQHSKTVRITSDELPQRFTVQPWKLCCQLSADANYRTISRKLPQIKLYYGFKIIKFKLGSLTFNPNIWRKCLRNSKMIKEHGGGKKNKAGNLVLFWCAVFYTNFTLFSETHAKLLNYRCEVGHARISIKINSCSKRSVVFTDSTASHS